MKTFGKLMLCLSLLLLALAYADKNNSVYFFDHPRQQSQFTHLLKELRCLVCQNQDLADSNASLAKDLRRQIYQMIIQGKSDTEIINYLTMRYGDFILFKPPLKLVTAFLWFGPLLFLMIGLLIFCYTNRPIARRVVE